MPVDFDYKNRQIAVINEEGEVFADIGELADWEAWAKRKVRKGESDFQAGKCLSGEEAMERLDKVLNGHSLDE